MADTEQKLTNTVAAAVSTAVAKPNVDAQPSAIAPIVQEVVNGLLPSILSLKGPWYLSRPIWGAIITLASLGAGAVGYTVAPEIQSTALNVITAAGPLIGAVVTIWGDRKKAAS